jgi:hypothetical protein
MKSSSTRAVKRVRKVVRLALTTERSALCGLTAEDDRLILQLKRQYGPTGIFRLIYGAAAAGYAILIRSDLEPLPDPEAFEEVVNGLGVNHARDHVRRGRHSPAAALRAGRGARAGAR